jgi:hypothetical protein
MIYLLTTNGLTPGGSSTVRIWLTPGGSSTVRIWLTPGGSSTVRIYTQTIHGKHNKTEYTEYYIHNNTNT